MSIRLFRVALVLAATLSAACGGEDGDTADTGRGNSNDDRVPTRPGAGDTTDDDDASDSSEEDAESDAVTPDGAASPDGTTAGPCTPNTSECLSLDRVRVCDASGQASSESECPDGSFCLPERNECVPSLCRPGSLRCATGTEREQCAADGSVYIPGTPCAEDQYCSEGDCRSSACLPSVMFLFDGSSSMSREFANVRASINAVTAANPDVAFGVSMFPVALGCTIGDGQRGIFSPAVDWPHVPISNGGAAVEAWLSSNDASGGATPLVSSLEWFAENVDSVWAIPENGHLIVMTEGVDTCRCDDGDPDSCSMGPLQAATESLVAQGVKVYVIGYNFTEAPAILNSIAANGGTSFTEFITAGDEATLTDAFELVVTEAKICN